MRVKCNFCETVMVEADVIHCGKDRICPVCGESVYLDGEEFEDYSENRVTKETLRKWGVY